jgi:hypothetical protein
MNWRRERPDGWDLFVLMFEFVGGESFVFIGCESDVAKQYQRGPAKPFAILARSPVACLAAVQFGERFVNLIA